MTHAYLILAHNEFPLLARLVSALDFPGNDLYIHIDKKVDDEVFVRVKQEMEDATTRAGLVFTPRTDIVWGDFSMIQAELLLLREASAAHHDYYHLLSGTDLPIKSHDEIMRFFQENAGKEFIGGYPIERSALKRIRYYYPFQHTVGHRYLRPLGLLQFALLPLQRLIGINRLRALPKDIYKGGNWFSVTHDFVTDLLEFYGREENLRAYRMTQCADEIFMQMFAFHSKYREQIYHVRWGEWEFPHNLRLVIWEKRGAGSPVTLSMDNLDQLLRSDSLWARKFSYEKHPDAVDAIMERNAKSPKGPPTTVADMQAEILFLKKETDTCILAHSYQAREILEIADVHGDSFALSRAALGRPERNMLLCGVRFMAEGVKLLAPEKTVRLCSPGAGCPMAEQMDRAFIEEVKRAHPDYTVVAYINTTAALKTVCDVCVTSSSAVKIVRGLPNDKILFIPDCNLGAYVASQVPEKEIKLLQGGCPIHAAVTVDEARAARAAHPRALLLVHPECVPGVTALADYVGSTAGIMDYAKQSDAKEFIIGTEASIAEHLQYKCPDKCFYALSKALLCPDMKLTTLPDVLLALRGEGGETIELDDDTMHEARKCIDRMIELGG